MKITTRTANIVFWLLVLMDIIGILLKLEWMPTFAKPLLMPALMLVMFSFPPAPASKTIFFSALLLSWLGDVLLMFDNTDPLFFILGLAAFLLAHLCYIFFFLKIRSPKPSFLKRKPILIILVLCYSLGLYLFLLPHLGELKIPVFVYAVVIGCMLLSSAHVFLKVNPPGNKYYVLGAGLFVISDSILALNKFYVSLPAAGAVIMLTYCAAQYFLVTGFGAQGKNS